MKRHLFNLLTLIGMMLTAASCSDDAMFGNNEPDLSGGESDKINFIVNTNDTPSRGGSINGSHRAPGAFIHSEDDSLYMKLEVSDINGTHASNSRASYTTADDINSIMMTCRSRSASGSSYYFSDTQFAKSGDTWISDPPYWWQNDESTHYNFYGYAPAAIPGATYNEDTDFTPTLEYTVPTDAYRHTDIVCNTLTQEHISTANMTVPLKMDHALACISFSCDEGIAAGTINTITLHDIYSHGILDLSTGSWSNVDTPADFKATTGFNTSGNLDITTDAAGTLFMLIPGSCSPSTSVEINFTAADGTSSTYTGSIATNWEAGRQYRYKVSIDPDLTIDLVPETQDAHYVIARAHVSAANLQPGQSWQLTATTSDGADVTLLADADLNEFQRQGFWIDEIVDGTTHTNARGTSTLTGSGATELCIFLPENVSDNNREITLSLTIAGLTKEIDTQTFQQYHPAWTSSGHGWEQTDDTTAEFGFDWNYTVCYTYLYTNSRGKTYCQSVIDENNARDFASVGSFYYSQIWPPTYGDRYYIKIDYSRLSSLKVYSNSRSNGWANTIEMNTIAGTAVTNSFETVIKNIKKTEAGKETESAFRIGNGQKNEAPAPTGDPITSSPAIGECLKKNRYKLIKTTNSSDDIAYYLYISDADIVWYLPAIDQFTGIPTDIKDPVVPGDCWSSNAETSSNAEAYLGNGSPAARLSVHKIRACRNR